MSAEKFIHRLEAGGLLEDSVLAEIREQVAASTFKISADAVAEMLVEQGHLTKFQADKLLGKSSGGSSKKKTTKSADKPSGQAAAKSASSAAEKKPNKGAEKHASRSPGAQADELGLAASESGLDLLPDADEPPAKQAAAKNSAKQPAAKSPADDGLDLVPDEDDEEPADDDAKLETLEDDGLAPLDDDGLETLDESGELESLDDEGLTPLDDGGLEALDDGGLEALDDGGLESMGTAGMPAGPAAAEGDAGFKKKTASKKPWESKLMLGGSACLALLIIGGIVLYFSLSTGTAKEMFAAAEEAYGQESYTQAISLYEKYLEKYPNDGDVSKARVKIGTAKIWQFVGGSSDKKPALDAAKEILPQIEKENAFSEVRAELASMLPEIAEGFSQRAKATEDIQEAQRLVDLSEEAMTLVNNPVYIPTSLLVSIRPRLDAIREDIELAIRNINRTIKLAEAIKAIESLVADGETVKAFEIRRDLLKEYPGLEQDSQLVAATLTITQREQELVKVGDSTLAPTSEPHPTKAAFRVAMASRNGNGNAGNEGHVVFALARGAVYGLRADTGAVLWRYFVGNATEYHPQPTSETADADVIATDQGRNELVRLKGATGELQWRLPVEESFAKPVLMDGRIYVCTASGRLLDIDAATGEVSRQAAIPQKLTVGPGTSSLQHFYQVGRHSNLYVLSQDSLECKEVYYLGHKDGTVVVPPVSVLGYVFVAENNGPDSCLLHVLSVDANGLNITTPKKMKSISLKGHVVVPPLLYGARIVVVTDLGAVHIFEVNTAKPESPVVNAVEPFVASFKEPMIGYFAADGGRLFVGNDRMTKYEIQTSRNRLLNEWIRDERDAFMGPPRVLGDTVYHVRRRKDAPSFTVAAISAENGKPFWEVDLGTPPALNWFDENKKEIHVITAQAELFEIGPTAFRAGVDDTPETVAVGAARTVAFTDVISLADNRSVLASPADRSKLVIHNPGSVSESGRLETVKVKLPAGVGVTARPVTFAGGLLTPLDNGQVAVIDPKSGDDLMHPFQPEVKAGTKIQWLPAAVVGTGGDAFVIADDQHRMFRVSVRPGTPSRLQADKEVVIEAKVVSGFAAAGDTVYGIVRSGNNEILVSYAAADLAAGSEWPLDGNVVWGPMSVADSVLLATDRGKLMCFEAGQKKRWETDLAYGPLVGQPLVESGDFLMASVSGTVWRLSAADGSEKAKFDLLQSLGMGVSPFVAGRFLLSGSDGTLYIIDGF